MEITPFQFFLFLGIGLIAAELLVFQATVFWFLFVGLGALVTMLLTYLVPETTWLSAWATFVIASAVFSVGLYRPLRKWQNQPGSIPGHDAMDQEVSVLEDISAEKPGKVSWSGADWQASLKEGETETIAAGTTAYISSMKGIRLTVRKEK